MACLVIIFAIPCHAADSPHGNYLARSWHSEDGLPSNVIRDVAQAADGYLWIATPEGITRFDGARFSGFSSDEESLLASRQPRALFPLPSGDVWISTARGGLLHWDRRKLRVLWDDRDPSSPQTRQGETVQVISAGQETLIERGEEIFRASADTLIPVARAPGLTGQFTAAREARAKRISSTPAATTLSHRDRCGRLWTAVPGRGLFVSTAPDDLTPQMTPEIPGGSFINALFEDEEGHLWVGTGGNGLFQIRPRRVQVLGSSDRTNDRTVFAVLEDRHGALWLGRKTGGIDRLHEGRMQHISVGEGGANRPVSALCEDAEGVLWAATRNGSVFRFRDDEFQLVTSSGTPISKVLAIASGPSGKLWFGGGQGIISLDGQKPTVHPGTVGDAVLDITALALSGSGGVVAGSADGSIYQSVDGRFTRVAATGNRAISALLADGEDGMWITTLGSGLHHWRDGKAFHFGEPCGLPELRLTCVLDDGNGSLWLGSLSGIIRVSKAQLGEIETGARKTADWIVLDREDGMLSRECTGAFQPAGWRRRDGTLCFPTVNGLAMVRPDELELNAVPPRVVIEAAKANGEAGSADSGKLNAGPGRARLEFRYTALSFTSPGKVRFQTRLEGLEGSDWNDAGPQRSAAFESVPPGSYRFRARASNGDGVWSASDAIMAVEVLPHFWETTWFRGSMVALGIAVAGTFGWAIARARMRGRLMRLELQTSREKERARIAQDLHDDLGASLTEISMLAHLAAEEEARGREPLREIAGKAHHLVGTLDEIVWAVNPRHDTLASLADYLAAFAEEFLRAAGIGLRRDLPSEIPPLALDAEQRHSLFLAFREALNNVVKHSGASEVRMHLEADERYLTLRVHDNGAGLPASTGMFSEGLRNMQERLASVGGACAFASDALGTNVTFTLPIQKHR